MGKVTSSMLPVTAQNQQQPATTGQGNAEDQWEDLGIRSATAAPLPPGLVPPPTEILPAAGSPSPRPW